MKRILTVIVLLLLVIGLPAENKFIDRLNGFDWIKWDPIRKAFFIQGYWNALICMVEINSVIMEKSTDADRIAEYIRIQNVCDWFTIEGTVGDWIYEIDRFYSTYKNRSKELWYVAGVAVRKDWFIKWEEAEEKN